MEKAFWKWTCQEGATRREGLVIVFCWFYEKEVVEEVGQGNGMRRGRGLASGVWGTAQNYRARRK